MPPSVKRRLKVASNSPVPITTSFQLKSRKEANAATSVRKPFGSTIRPDISDNRLIVASWNQVEIFFEASRAVNPRIKWKSAHRRHSRNPLAIRTSSTASVIGKAKELLRKTMRSNQVNGGGYFLRIFWHE